MVPDGPILLILDLDETLLHATEEPLRRGHDFLMDPYAVYLRPFLSEFLTAPQWLAMACVVVASIGATRSSSSPPAEPLPN